MQITQAINAGAIVLTLAGRMDFQSRKVFQGAIENVKLDKPHQIILNFSKVPFIDSAAIGLLMVAHKSFTESQISFSLEIPKGDVLEILTLANIGKIIPISVTEG